MFLWYNKTKKILCPKSPAAQIEVTFFPLVLLRIREKEKAKLCVSQALR